MTQRLYVAYGSNLHLKQMGWRCPQAKVVGKGMLKDWQLTFRGVATIEPQEGAETPVAVWDIQPTDEVALDRYEGYPSLYRKENVTVTMDDGSELTAMVYIMNRGYPSMPNQGYFNTIRQGYDDVGLDPTYLKEALTDTDRRMKDQGLK